MVYGAEGNEGSVVLQGLAAEMCLCDNKFRLKSQEPRDTLTASPLPRYSGGGARKRWESNLSRSLSLRTVELGTIANPQFRSL